MINSLCFIIGWFWCVLLGIRGQSILAVVGAIFLILFQLHRAKVKNKSIYIQDAILVIFFIPLGLLLEIILIQTNTLYYTNTTHMLPPVWIVSLYPLLSLLMNHSLKIIKKSYFASFLLGFLAAPLSYITGVKLGGVTFGYPLFQAWTIIGFCWGLFLCLISKIGKSIEKATKETLEDINSKTSLELLYDGECPLCKREICLLRKKDNQTRIKFIDISSKDFSPAEHKNIDYNTAMSQIHAIDEKENLLMGVRAFAATYARCQMLITSTLMRISFIKSVLEPLYAIFAKKRLWITGRMKNNIRR